MIETVYSFTTFTRNKTLCTKMNRWLPPLALMAVQITIRWREVVPMLPIPMMHLLVGEDIITKACMIANTAIPFPTMYVFRLRFASSNSQHNSCLQYGNPGMNNQSGMGGPGYDRYNDYGGNQGNIPPSSNLNASGGAGHSTAGKVEKALGAAVGSNALKAKGMQKEMLAIHQSAGRNQSLTSSVI